MARPYASRLALPALALLVLAGCATARDPRDPWEPFNRAIYGFNETVDQGVIRPAAEGYRYVVPAAVRIPISHFFSNLNDVVVTFNDLLQGKFQQAVQDGARFVINSTFGFLGFGDVATHMGLEKHNEDFGQTLGYWGMESGPYLVLPFLGPNSVRDTIGLFADYAVHPVSEIDPARAQNQTILYWYLHRRSDALDTEKVLDDAAIDRYVFLRDAYFQRRQYLIYDGTPPRMKENDAAREAPDAAEAEPPAAAAEPVAPPAAAPATAVGQPQAHNIYEPKVPQLDEPAAAPAPAPLQLVRLWLPGDSAR